MNFSYPSSPFLRFHIVREKGRNRKEDPLLSLDLLNTHRISQKFPWHRALTVSSLLGSSPKKRPAQVHLSWVGKAQLSEETSARVQAATGWAWLSEVRWNSPWGYAHAQSWQDGCRCRSWRHPHPLEHPNPGHLLHAGNGDSNYYP